MIKFIAGNADSTLIGLGLTDRNMELLRQGRPIKVSLKDMDVPEQVPASQVNVLVFYGKTEKDIEETLSEFISAQTVVRDERGDKPPEDEA